MPQWIAHAVKVISFEIQDNQVKEAVNVSGLSTFIAALIMNFLNAFQVNINTIFTVIMSILGMIYMLYQIQLKRLEIRKSKMDLKQREKNE